MQPGWDWCQACGFDPEGLKPYGWTPAPVGMAASSPSAHAAPAATATAAPPWSPAGAPPAPPPGTPSAAAGGSPLAGQAIGIVVAVVLGLAAIGGVAWFVLRDDGKSSDVATSSSSADSLPPVVDLVRATSPDGSYSIGFPGQPDPPDSLPAPDPGQTIMGWSENNAFDPSASHGYLVISQPFAAEAAPIHQEMALDAFGELFGADPNGATIETTLLGYPARRFTFSSGGQAATGIAVATTKDIFLIMTVGPAPDAERQAVEASFQILR